MIRLITIAVKLMKIRLFIVMLSFVMLGIMLIVMKSRYDAIAYTVWFKL
jgi:hypothetical protein